MKDGSLPGPSETDINIYGVWGAENVFSDSECGTIRELARRHVEDGKAREALTRSGSGEVFRSDYRHAQTAFLKPDHTNRWIFERLTEVINPVNSRLFRFSLAGFEEGVQLSRYPAGNGYGWHVDLGQGKTLRRKLSITVQLSQPDDYEGGDLEFMNPQSSALRTAGSVCVFPSFMLHRVAPITRGQRWSMVSWISGEPFR